MIVNREPEPAHWRDVGGGGGPPPGLALRLALPLASAVACYLVARFLFDLWIARAADLPIGRAYAGAAESARLLALWLAGGVALLGLMTDRRCRRWTRVFAWPVLGDGPRLSTVAIHVGVILLACLLVFAVETAILQRRLAEAVGGAFAGLDCAVAAADCAARRPALLRAVVAEIDAFAWLHVALFAGLGLATAVAVRRSRSVTRLIFSTPHGIFLFHRLDSYAVAALAQLTLLVVLSETARLSLIHQAPAVVEAGFTDAPTLLAMFADPLDNALFQALFGTGFLCCLGAYAGGFLRLASPYHSLLEAHRATLRDG